MPDDSPTEEEPQHCEVCGTKMIRQSETYVYCPREGLVSHIEDKRRMTADSPVSERAPMEGFGTAREWRERAEQAEARIEQLEEAGYTVARLDMVGVGAPMHYPEINQDLFTFSRDLPDEWSGQLHSVYRILGEDEKPGQNESSTE